MIDTPKAEFASDFRQRYRHSFGFLLRDNIKTLVYISDVTSSRVTFDTQQGPGFYVNMDSKVEFEFLPITRGWFFTTTYGWVLLERTPARQYCRGISSSNTSARMVDGSGRLLSIPLTLDILADVFVKKPVAPQGTSLNHVFLLLAGRVWFYSTLIGTVDHAANIIKLNSPLAKQEIVDFSRRAGVSYTVETNV